jgi:hypothetical protein
MKKTILLAAFSLMVAFSSSAQYNKGNFILNAGLGLGYYYAPAGVALQFNGEYFFTDKLSIGPYLGVASWSRGYFGDNYKYTFIDFGARGSYHFNEIFGITNDKIDVYGGVFLGFVTASYSGPGGSIDDNSYGSTARAGIHAGARYFFSPKVGAYGELGYGMAPLSIGLTFKF